MYKCKKCSIEFMSNVNLEKHHKEKHAENVEKNLVPVSNSSHDQGNVQSIPVHQTLTRQVGVVRQYNCYDCPFQGNSSKNLLRHVRESPSCSRTDSLIETCHTCKTEFKNFEDLMAHRKAVHTSTIKECNLYKTNQCKFGPARCWYRHGPAVENQAVKSVPQSPVFQPAPAPVIPPDLVTQLSNLSLLISNLTTTLLPQGENNLNSRFHGH